MSTVRNSVSSVTLLRVVQEAMPEYHLLFTLKTNTYFKDKEISEVMLCL